MKSLEEYTQAGEEIYQGLCAGMQGYQTTESIGLIPVKFLLREEMVETEALDRSRGFPSIHTREFVKNFAHGIEAFVGGAYQTEFHDREIDILNTAVLLPIRREAAREAMGQAIWSMKNGHHLLRIAGVDSVEHYNFDAVDKEKEVRDTKARLEVSYTSLVNFVGALQNIGAR